MKRFITLGGVDFNPSRSAGVEACHQSLKQDFCVRVASRFVKQKLSR